MGREGCSRGVTDVIGYIITITISTNTYIIKSTSTDIYITITILDICIIISINIRICIYIRIRISICIHIRINICIQVDIDIETDIRIMMYINIISFNIISIIIRIQIFGISVRIIDEIVVILVVGSEDVVITCKVVGASKTMTVRLTLVIP